jgi:hypothetical protein
MQEANDMRKHLLHALPLSVLLLTACGGEDDEPAGQGSIRVRAYGESFIEDGIPSDAVDDDWAIEFNRFDVSFRDIVVAGVALDDPDTVDLAASSNGDGHELGTVAVAAGAHAQPAFGIAQVELEGLAERDGVLKTFHWLFAARTNYEHCETTTKVAAGETTTFQITVHADHLFYDSLVSETPQLLFQPIADADNDEDGDITQVELAALDIGAYDPGNEDIDDLWSFLLAQQRTLGHVDGEGHCDAAAAD